MLEFGWRKCDGFNFDWEYRVYLPERAKELRIKIHHFDFYLIDRWIGVSW